VRIEYGSWCGDGEEDRVPMALLLLAGDGWMRIEHARVVGSAG
jgi:hypothetical protein